MCKPSAFHTYAYPYELKFLGIGGDCDVQHDHAYISTIVVGLFGAVQAYEYLAGWGG